MSDKKEKWLFRIWIILLLPIIPVFIPLIMFNIIGIEEYICIIVQQILIGFWIFICFFTAFFTIYGISTMDRIQEPANLTTYNRIDKIVFSFILIISIIIAYYMSIEI